MIANTKILSSHGHFIVSSKGIILERHDESGELPRVRRFDFRPHVYPDGIYSHRPEKDILCVAYWTEDGKYEPVEVIKEART